MHGSRLRAIDTMIKLCNVWHMVPMGMGGLAARPLRSLTALLIAGLVIAQAAIPAGAQSDDGISLAGSAGFDGYFKEQHWIPVQVELANEGPDLEAQIEIRQLPERAGEGIQYSWPIALPSVARKRSTFYVFPGSNTRSLELSLTADGKPIVQSNLPLSRLSISDSLLGVMAANPTPFTAIRSAGGSSGSSRVEVAVLTPDSLPDQAPALSALDAMIISDQDTGTLSAAQRQALAGWVASGGRLLIGGGPNWQKTTAGLTELLPMTVSGTQSAASLDSLGSFVGIGQGPTGNTILAISHPVEDSEVLIEQDGMPLLLTRSFGLGEVAFLAADPSLEPLRDWAPMRTLYQALLLGRPASPAWASGFRDGSAASAASSFPNLSLPPVAAICGFLLLYTFALGPLHYLILRRSKRREIAWITIPGLVLLFSGVAYVVGSTSRGTRPVLNRMAVVHVPKGAEQARLTGLVGMFSPSRRSLAVQVPAGFMARPLAPDYSLASGEWHFSQTDEGIRVEDLRIDIDSVMGLVIEGNTPAPSFVYELSTKIASNTLRVEGELASVDLGLENAALLTRYGSIALGDLREGEPRAVRASLPVSVNPSNDLSNIMGALGVTTTYYPYGSSSGNEMEHLRRHQFLRAIEIGETNFPWAGIYLAGWSDTMPAQVELSSASREAGDLTLYLIELDVAQESAPEPPLQPTVPPALGTGILELTPDDFSWRVAEANPPSPTPWPYGAQVRQGSYTLSFTPDPPIWYKSVLLLKLHLEGYAEGAGPGDLISLWDFAGESWAPIPGLDWGENSIPNPSRHVGPDGELRLRVENMEEGIRIVVQRSDFSMVIEQ